MKNLSLAIAVASTLLGASTVVAEQKLESLLVYGDGFVFSVREPNGWRADTEGAARLAANVLFYRLSESADSAVALLRVRLNSKSDEKIESDLQYDMDGYRRQYPTVQFRDIKIDHPTYKVAAKLFLVPNVFYEYVVYINPGAGKPWIFSASMNKQKSEAAVAELEAFQAVVRSLVLM